MSIIRSGQSSELVRMGMSNLDIYNKEFIECLSITDAQLNADLKYQSVEQWDSVGHMQLVAGLEEAFDIMLDTDDIIDLNSYDAGKEILKKYDIEF